MSAHDKRAVGIAYPTILTSRSLHEILTLAHPNGQVGIAQPALCPTSTEVAMPFSAVFLAA